MKLSAINRRARSDAGLPLHLRDPETNEPLMDGDKALMILVRGSAGPEAQNASRAAIRYLRELREGEAKIEVAEDFHQLVVRQALPFVAGLVNFERDDGTPATVDDAYAVLDSVLSKPLKVDEDGKPIKDQRRSFAQQVLDFVSEADRELGNG